MMKKTRVLLCGLTVLAAVGATSRASAADEYDAQAESQLVQLINLARGQHGLPPLQEDARLHGEAVLATRLALNGAYSYMAGETAAYNRTPNAAHETFMHSPPHRTIILDVRYDSVGVGVVVGDGMVWVTEDFAHLQAP
jgi:uncharacterized protein YkwD